MATSLMSHGPHGTPPARRTAPPAPGKPQPGNLGMEGFTSYHRAQDGPFPTTRDAFFPRSSLLSSYIIKHLLDHIFVSLFPSWHSLCTP